jgi:hypothetical protein
LNCYSLLHTASLSLNIKAATQCMTA